MDAKNEEVKKYLEKIFALENVLTTYNKNIKR